MDTKNCLHKKINFLQIYKIKKFEIFIKEIFMHSHL